MPFGDLYREAIICVCRVTLSFIEGERVATLCIFFTIRDLGTQNTYRIYPMPDIIRSILEKYIILDSNDPMCFL